MIKRRFWFLMILIMMATPVWSALGYYSGQAGALSATVRDAVQHDDHCRHQDKFTIDCHASGSCIFHVCGDGGMAAQIAFIQAYSPYRYQHWQNIVPHSLISSPETRPPISRV